MFQVKRKRSRQIDPAHKRALALFVSAALAVSSLSAAAVALGDGQQSKVVEKWTWSDSSNLTQNAEGGWELHVQAGEENPVTAEELRTYLPKSILAVLAVEGEIIPSEPSESDDGNAGTSQEDESEESSEPTESKLEAESSDLSQDEEESNPETENSPEGSSEDPSASNVEEDPESSEDSLLDEDSTDGTDGESQDVERDEQIVSPNNPGVMAARAQLPVQLIGTTAGEEWETIQIIWELSEYPENGMSEGSLPLTASLPEGYTMGADKDTPALTVVFDAETDVSEEDDLPAIYLNGQTGNDANPGTLDQPVATYAKAAELAKNASYTTIYVTGTVTVSGTETWSDGLTLMRHNSFTDGTLVTVDADGSLTLGNTTIDGANLTVLGSGTSASDDAANLIRVEGNLNLADGAVLENHQAGPSYSAAVLVYNGTLNMDGGEIRNNVGGSWGGGVAVVGTSSDNAAVMNFTNGTISNNMASTNGGGIYLYTYATLNMDGGTVTSNSAPNNGGGIYVGRDAVATIESGNITNNSQTSSQNYGGGGIYVESDQNYSTSEPGKLYLYNVEITDNSCSDSAAGAGYDSTIAACNTAVLQVNITDGAVIHDNNTRYDIMAYFDNTTSTMQISPFMLGGGLYNWIDYSGNTYDVGGLAWNFETAEETGWAYATTKSSTSTDSVTGLGRIRTVISGNTSVVLGAAIGTNGEVYIGKSDGDVTLTIRKVWDESVTEIADSVTIDVFSTDGTGTTVEIGSVTLSEDNNWETTIEHLPKYDSDGNEYTYSVSEDTTEYNFEVTKEKLSDDDGDDSTEAYVFTVTNTPRPQEGTLTISKQVRGESTNRSFTFRITLTDENGASLSGSYPFTGSYSGTVSNGSTFTLADGESIIVSGLPAGTQYRVDEVSSGDYYVFVYGEGDPIPNTGSIAAGDSDSVRFVNVAPSDPDQPPYTPPERPDEEPSSEPPEESSEPSSEESSEPSVLPSEPSGPSGPSAPTSEPTSEPVSEPAEPTLPQTGQLWWPVAALLGAGAVLVAVGALKPPRGSKRHER